MKNILFLQKIKFVIMELNLVIDYQQLFNLVKQLPYKTKIKLFKDLLPEINSSKIKTESINKEEDYNDFQKLLINGPVMSDEQFNNYKNLRENLNKWITKSY